jgi:hypothetical protein
MEWLMNGELERTYPENRRSDFCRIDRRVYASLNIVQINKTHDTRRGLPPLEGRLDSWFPRDFGRARKFRFDTSVHGWQWKSSHVKEPDCLDAVLLAKQVDSRLDKSRSCGHLRATSWRRSTRPNRDSISTIFLFWVHSRWLTRYPTNQRQY